MGLVQSIFARFQKVPTQKELDDIKSILSSINEKLEKIEARDSEYLTSIHKKEEFIEETQKFFKLLTENIDQNNLEDSLKRYESKSGETENFKCMKHGIEKQEKNEILMNKIRNRRHSSILEAARISVKEEKLFGNLDGLRKKKESPVMHVEGDI